MATARKYTSTEVTPAPAPVQEVARRRRLIIESVTVDERRFRPSDWIERLAANFAEFGTDRRLRYQKGVAPGICNGQKVLMVDSDLADKNPAAFGFIEQFISSNNLRHHWVDCIA